MCMKSIIEKREKISEAVENYRRALFDYLKGRYEPGSDMEMGDSEYFIINALVERMERNIIRIIERE